MVETWHCLKRATPQSLHILVVFVGLIGRLKPLEEFGSGALHVVRIVVRVVVGGLL